MTSIMLTVTGAQAQASVAGTLTSGMVGIPVTIEYDEAWEGLTKNLVCRCSKSGSADEEYRSIMNVENTAVVAHEVMKAGMLLYLGVEGCSSDGTLVIPTVWAMCGSIQRGANTGEDLSVDPTLPVWNQLQVQIEQIKRDAITQEQVDDIQADVQAARRAAEAAAQRAEEAVGNSNGSGQNLLVDSTLTQSGQAADAKATGDALESKLSASELDGAINDALARAREKGEFDGAPGENGTTPHIGENGNWWIGDTDIGVRAQGPQGEPGPAYELTNNDRKDIVDAVLAGLPVWTGGDY